MRGMVMLFLPLGLAVFALAMWFVVRPALVRYFRYSLRQNRGRLSATGLAVLLVCVLLASVATNLIGIFAVFGAFLLGAVLSDQEELRRAARAKLHDLVTSFFVPVFFVTVRRLFKGSSWQRELDAHKLHLSEHAAPAAPAASAAPGHTGGAA